MGNKMERKQAGFTIVELLIVIVVIAILAAVSVVAYTGIQNRANDSAVKADLNNLAKQIQLAAAETGEFPAGGATRLDSSTNTGAQHTFPGFTFRPSKSAYYTANQNLSYCTGGATSDGSKVFHIRARSKSGTTFSYSSEGGLTDLGSIYMNGASACAGISYPQSWSYGYYDTSDTWHSWTNG